MIKRTLYFANPAYLKQEMNHLVVSYPKEEAERKQVPIEDTSLVVLDHDWLTITKKLN